jgi:hypothetical protein
MTPRIHTRAARAPRLHPSAAVLALCVMSTQVCCSGGAATRDFQMRGAAVLVSSTAPFTLHPDFPARVESTVAEALRYWGGTWAMLDGKTITLTDDRHVVCPGTAGATGCYDGSIRISTRDLESVSSCIEETVLVHEIGHAVIGDPDHLDPRWLDFGAVARELEGRPGYDAQGETSCTLYPSVWRHPPTQQADPVAP